MEDGSRSPEVEQGRVIANTVASDSGRDVLRILSEPIDAAGAANARSWCLTQSKRGDHVTLNVGRILAWKIYADRVVVALSESSLTLPEQTGALRPDGGFR